MYYVTREFYPHGIEGERTDCSFKEFPTLEKACAYAHRYTYGRRFVRVTVEDESGKVVYEELDNGDIYVVQNGELTEVTPQDC